MTALVIGARGFLGKEVVKGLQHKSTPIVTTSRTGQNADHSLDISNYKDFEKLPADGLTSIVNCASALPGGYKDTETMLETFYQSNILGAHNICKFAAKNPHIKHVVHLSLIHI